MARKLTCGLLVVVASLVAVNASSPVASWRARYETEVVIPERFVAALSADSSNEGPLCSQVDGSGGELRRLEVEHVSASAEATTANGDIVARLIVAVDGDTTLCNATTIAVTCHAGLQQRSTARLLSCDSAYLPAVSSRRQEVGATGALVDRGNRYHDQLAAEARIAALVEGYPALAHSFTIGTTAEGRAITALRISTTPTANDAAKPEVVLTGVHHAREWISLEVPLGIAELLCVLYYANSRVRTMLDAVEFIIVPVVNPDGFIHSHSTARYWRKNRRVNSDGTIGVDLNRNYPTYWGDSLGASPTPSSDTYHGPSPASEPEVQAVMNMMRDRNIVSRLTFFVSYHNYGSEVLYPYGNAATTRSPIEPLLVNLSSHLASVIMPGSPNGQRYDAYKASGLYPVSGDTVDWVHQTFNSVPALTVELRPSLSGCCGFSLPEEQLNATVMENAAAVFFAAEFAVASAALPNAGTNWWFSDGPAGSFDASRVTPVDANSNGVPDWFDRCPGGAGGGIATLLTSTQLFPRSDSANATAFTWPPYNSTSLDVLKGAGCPVGVASAYSTLSPVAGTSRWLRLTIVPAQAPATTRRSVVSELLLTADCTVATTAAAGTTSALETALRAILSDNVEAWHARSLPSTARIELRNASWQRTGVRTTCMLDFRMSGLAAPGVHDSVDHIFGAVYAAGRSGNLTGYPTELASVDDAALAPDPFAESGIPVPNAPTPAPSAAATTAAAIPPSPPTSSGASTAPPTASISSACPSLRHAAVAWGILAAVLLATA